MSATSRALCRTSNHIMNSVQGKAGVYFITPLWIWDSTEQNEEILIKIGSAKDLQHRLNAYLLYWPVGIKVFAIFECTSNGLARRFEKSVHEYLNTKAKYVVTDHSHDEEWFSLSVDDVAKIVDLISSNTGIKYPMPYKHRPSYAGKTVFPFKQLTPATRGHHHVVIAANPQVGSAKIKPMPKPMKRILDQHVKFLGSKSPLRTGIKPCKTTKKSSYKSTSKKLFND
jgi:hypothetical protein